MGTEVKKRSPNLDLRGEVGMYVVGEFIRRYENKNFPGKYSSLIKVEDTNGSTTLWDGEKETEVSIEAGDSVFLSESSWLSNFLSERVKGDKIKITYTGRGKPKKKGYKAAYEYKTEVL